MTRMFQPLMTLAAGCLLMACATAPPTELVNARLAYSTAADGTAAMIAPAELKTAEQALARAEKAFRDDGADGKTKDLAYVAERRAQIATAIGDRRLAEKNKDSSEERRANLSKEFQAEDAQALATAKDRLGDEQQRSDAERQARIQAERDAQASANDARQANAETDAANKKAAAAESELAATRKALAKWAKLAENERGLVITLSSGVLFATGKSAVLPAAANRLSQVASLLIASPGRTVSVEGHTDNAGGDAFNQTLSQQRADAVRAFLVAKGVPASSAGAVGYGETRPIATNDTTTGRASNRRVEIVLAALPMPTGAQK